MLLNTFLKTSLVITKAPIATKTFEAVRKSKTAMKMKKDKTY